MPFSGFMKLTQNINFIIFQFQNLSFQSIVQSTCLSAPDYGDIVIAPDPVYHSALCSVTGEKVLTHHL